MQVLELPSPGATHVDGAERLRVAKKPIPKPGSGQVLVRVEAAPCNPSDLGFLSGSYAIDRPLPAVPGFECSGVVVAAGGGLMARALVGRRVSTGGQGKGDGTWAEYYVAEAFNCIPLMPGVDFEQGCSLIVNPMTAFGLLSRVRDRGSKAIIQNAAMSQLGGMIRALAAERKLAVINLVRREEQAAALREQGAAYALSTDSADFPAQLSELATRIGASTALDAVAGEMTGMLLAALPPGGQVIVYGSLSGTQPSALGSTDIVFRGKSVAGFHLGRHVAELGLAATMADAFRVQRAVRRGTIRMDIHRRVSLAEAPAAVAAYAANMSAGKTLILPRL